MTSEQRVKKVYPTVGYEWKRILKEHSPIGRAFTHIMELSGRHGRKRGAWAEVWHSIQKQRGKYESR